MLSRPTLLALAALAAFAAPSPVLARRSYTVRVPPFEVPANKNREICVFTPLPAKDVMNIGEVRITNIGGKRLFATHHLIVYSYKGSLADVKAGEVKDTPACLNFGSGKPSDLSIVATSQGPHSRWVMPRGTALKLTPDDSGGKPVIGIVLNSHWINGDSVPHRARAKVTLITKKSKDVKRELKPIFEVVANAFIDVPPGQTKTVGYHWAPADPGLSVFGSFLGGTAPPNGPACVTMIVGHMHKRGKLFTANLIDPDGTKTLLYQQTVYSDPIAKLENPPLLISPGQRIDYQCTHDNATEPRLGCEEQAGVPPGQSVAQRVVGGSGLTKPSGAAKLCTAEGPDPGECPPTDPAYPGHTYTGNCVKARLVFGFTSEDDMCILPGYYYAADPNAPAGQECTL
ncbi:MAG TPA: hypothetical protein VKH82_05340 [Candidatus Binatia bacterium]|nr:hypothetical protein [Candidatus Binatia bacterium]